MHELPRYLEIQEVEGIFSFHGKKKERKSHLNDLEFD